jgi:hypothetical protein
VQRYTLAQEKRLAKQVRTEKFNKEFYKTVERGVFKEIGPEEMAACDGPVNYISMVEAFKEGPHSTTPLRICMNSSLGQPKPVGLSLNNCLMKGLLALVDLFMLTLCIQEHRYELMKDLSKFYQRVDANPTAQNLRRVMWRGGNSAAKIKVYITTTVNFGHKSAGCIAIVAARETAERFRGEYPEAAWFLQYRTYVNDATEGVDTMERVDVRFNLGAKRAGLHLQDNVKLKEEPEKVLPKFIPKRELGEWHRASTIPWDYCVASRYASRC